MKKPSDVYRDIVTVCACDTAGTRHFTVWGSITVAWTNLDLISFAVEKIVALTWWCERCTEDTQDNVALKTVTFDCKDEICPKIWPVVTKRGYLRSWLESVLNFFLGPIDPIVNTNLNVDDTVEFDIEIFERWNLYNKCLFVDVENGGRVCPLEDCVGWCFLNSMCSHPDQ